MDAHDDALAFWQAQARYERDRLDKLPEWRDSPERIALGVALVVNTTTALRAAVIAARRVGIG